MHDDIYETTAGWTLLTYPRANFSMPTLTAADIHVAADGLNVTVPLSDEWINTLLQSPLCSLNIRRNKQAETETNKLSEEAMKEWEELISKTE